jgi:hypothetical protein
MAWTQADVDALEAAIASGELSVRFRDREVTYRSMPELIGAHRLISNKVNGVTGPRHRTADFTGDSSE